jgi:hypothetical protein
MKDSSLLWAWGFLLLLLLLLPRLVMAVTTMGTIATLILLIPLTPITTTLIMDIGTIITTEIPIIIHTQDKLTLMWRQTAVQQVTKQQITREQTVVTTMGTIAITPPQQQTTAQATYANQTRTISLIGI